MPESLDLVFKALADPTRRQLLDRLHSRNGQTLGELCSSLGMARQSASQHLAVLEAANLVSTVWHGRQKLHYLNPVPLHELQERWMSTFEPPGCARSAPSGSQQRSRPCLTRPPTSTSPTSRRAPSRCGRR